MPGTGAAVAHDARRPGCDNPPMPVSLGAILTAMVTPFDARGRVDEEAAVRLMNHLLDHGSDGLVICGTTGEASTLDDEEHLGHDPPRRLRRSATAGTIVAGVGSNDTRHAVRLTERASELGPDALLSVNPYYNRPSRRGIVRHYEEICRATELPILLYNIPQRTGADLPNDFLAELAQLDNIVARQAGQPGQSGQDRRAADLRRQRRPVRRRPRPRRARRDPHRLAFVRR